MNSEKYDLFFEQLHRVKKGLLMLDYDGTLAPFREDRSAAHPYPGVCQRLSQLAHDGRFRVVIISGRQLQDLKQLLRDVSPLPELWGSHGLERLLPDGSYWKATIDGPTMRGLEEAERVCQKLSGAPRCERKPFGVAFHFRGMDERAKEQILTPLQKAWEAISSPCLGIYPFDGGVELTVKDRNKGDAVRAILKEVVEKTAVAYLGDDLTDENAFEALGERGLKVLVIPKQVEESVFDLADDRILFGYRKEPRTTLADIQLTSPHELLSFFDDCLAGKNPYEK